jgi:phosphonate transport system substrate-binding protein
VFVTDGIYNDTLTVSKRTVNDALQAAIEQAFINLVQDESDLPGDDATFATVADIFSVYSHEGYVLADDADYDGAREANALIA